MPRAVVEALEADDFGHFASPLYARSFLMQYGQYLSVDVSQWIEDLVPTALIDSQAAEAFIELSNHNPLPAIREKEKSKSSGGGAMAAIWIIIITGGLGWGGMVIYRMLDERLSPPTPAPQQAAAPVSEPQEKASEPPVEKPVATAVAEPPKRAIIVEE